MKAIRNIKALTWGILYLICIPLFACIYYFLIPSEFYHSTSQFEKKNIEDVKLSILQEFNDLINSYCIEKYPKDTLINDAQISLRNIECSNLKTYNDKFQFTITYYVTQEMAQFDIKNKTVLGKKTMPIKNSADIQLSYFGKPAIGISGEDIYVSNLFYDTTSANIPIKITTFFPTAIPIKRNGSFGERMLAIPISLHKKVEILENTLEGFPYKTPGSFWRMFYLSSITITTVGFGDIVPITTTARILVSIEAILGVIFIGLFLNSLAKYSFKK